MRRVDGLVIRELTCCKRAELYTPKAFSLKMKAKIANPRRLDIPGNGDCSPDREVLTAVLKQWRQKLGYCSIFAAVPAILASHVSEGRSV